VPTCELNVFFPGFSAIDSTGGRDNVMRSTFRTSSDCSRADADVTCDVG
jgi:hypothetical protein